MNYSESSSSNSSKASTSQDNSHLFCEPGPSRSNRQQPQQPQSQPQNQQQPPPINGGGGQSSSSGNNNNRNPNRNSEVLEYDLDALDNFPDPSPGDFDPSNSLSSSFPPIMDSHPGNFESQYLQFQNVYLGSFVNIMFDQNISMLVFEVFIVFLKDNLEPVVFHNFLWSVFNMKNE